MILHTCLFFLGVSQLAFTSPLDKEEHYAEKRANLCSNPYNCVVDNVYRALVNPTRASEVYPFCSSYIGLDKRSYTLTNLAVTVTVTIPTESAFYSSKHTTQQTDFYIPQSFAPGVSHTPIIYPTPAPAPTSTSGATPSYVAMYLPSRISSACNCIPLPTTVTSPGTLTISKGRVTDCTTHIETVAAYPNSYTSRAAMCNPSVTQNQQYVTAVPTRPVRTILPIPIIDQKADCCQLCADTVNCIYWNYNAAGQCRVVYGIDNVQSQNSPDDRIADTCPNGVGLHNGFGAQAGPDEKNVYGPGLCASELYAQWQSSESYGDWCDDYGYCDRCQFYGGAECH